MPGPCLAIWYYETTRGRHPAKEFVDADSEIKAKFLAIARQLAEHGAILVPSRGHWLKGKYRTILELKPGRGRVFGFMDEAILYLTNGAPKKNKKEQEEDYKRALRVRDAHMKSKR